MVIEQLLRDWIVERNNAAELSVAARSPKAIASEIEGLFSDQLARAKAEAYEVGQQLIEKERALNRSLDIIAKLEGQLVQLRDRTDRALADKDRSLELKDEALVATSQASARFQEQATASRDKLEARLEKAEGLLATRSEELKEQVQKSKQLDKTLKEKDRLLENYQEKFGVIIKAVR